MRLLLAVILAAASAGAQDLARGNHQIRFFIGPNFVDGLGRTDHPSIGAGYDIGIGRNLAITTGYTWNLVETASAETWAGGVVRLRAKARFSVHDIMAGPRFQVPIGRVTPFVAPLGGVVIASGVATVSGGGIDAKGDDSAAKPAAGAGSGFEVRMGRGWSLLMEAKAIRPRDLGWYGHVGFGFTYRTGMKSR